MTVPASAAARAVSQLDRRGAAARWSVVGARSRRGRAHLGAEQGGADLRSSVSVAEHARQARRRVSQADSALGSTETPVSGSLPDVSGATGSDGVRRAARCSRSSAEPAGAPSTLTSTPARCSLPQRQEQPSSRRPAGRARRAAASAIADPLVVDVGAAPRERSAAASPLLLQSPVSTSRWTLGIGSPSFRRTSSGPRPGAARRRAWPWSSAVRSPPREQGRGRGLGALGLPRRRAPAWSPRRRAPSGRLEEQRTRRCCFSSASISSRDRKVKMRSISADLLVLDVEPELVEGVRRHHPRVEATGRRPRSCRTWCRRSWSPAAWRRRGPGRRPPGGSARRRR